MTIILSLHLFLYFFCCSESLEMFRNILVSSDFNTLARLYIRVYSIKKIVD